MKFCYTAAILLFFDADSISFFLSAVAYNDKNPPAQPSLKESQTGGH
jgi:hypothetical protein